MDQQSSLLCPTVSDEEKKFDDIHIRRHLTEIRLKGATTLGKASFDILTVGIITANKGTDGNSKLSVAIYPILLSSDMLCAIMSLC
jgi:hypothetical protein